MLEDDGIRESLPPSCGMFSLRRYPSGCGELRYGSTDNHVRPQDRSPKQDAWDGYRANRNRVLDHLYYNRIDNTIMLSGDSHANWVSDLAREFWALSAMPSPGPADTHRRSQPEHHVRLLSLCLWSLALKSRSSYDPITGDGAIGVEFAGTAVSSTSTFGAGISPANADKISARYVVENTDLQWSEGSYRGFFTLTLDLRQARATYWAMRDVSE